jgi:hypothetical protein
MGTNRDFQDMLNEYLPNNLFESEMVKRDYFLNKVEKDNNWKGGKIIVPFHAAGASSVKFGGLTDSADIGKDKYVRGSIDDYQEVWGSLIFDHRDLMDHSGKVNEDSFLKILPKQVDDFIEYMKMCVSINIMAGPHFATATSNGAADGTITVDRIDRFQLDQKCVIDDGATAQADVYVIAVDVNNDKVTLSATRGGAALDISTYLLADATKFYHDGVLVAGTATNKFNSLKSALLSAANGGSSTLHGKTKLAYPYLQAANISGATISATNILDKIFDAATRQSKLGRNLGAIEVVMAQKHLGSVMKLIEAQKGGYKVSEGSRKADIYGWEEVEITSVSGKRLKLVGVNEMDEDVIELIDWSALVFRSNGFFKKRTAPDGKQYYESRATDGYVYIVDICLFGELEVNNPTKCAIIHSIPNYA